MWLWDYDNTPKRVTVAEDAETGGDRFARGWDYCCCGVRVPRGAGRCEECKALGPNASPAACLEAARTRSCEAGRKKPPRSIAPDCFVLDSDLRLEIAASDSWGRGLVEDLSVIQPAANAALNKAFDMAEWEAAIVRRERRCERHEEAIRRTQQAQRVAWTWLVVLLATTATTLALVVCAAREWGR